MVEGKRETFPVIFLHGIPGGAFIWAPVITALNRQRLAVAPDLPGWGRSVSAYGTTRPTLDPEGATRWLFGVAAAQGIDRFDLVAHGSSCWLALELLKREARRVRRMAMVCAAFEIPRKSWWQRLGQRDWNRRAMARWLKERSGLGSEVLERWRGEFESLCGANRRSPHLPATRYARHCDEYLAVLRDFRGAKLDIRGSMEPLPSGTTRRFLKSAFTESESVAIEGGGCFPMLNSPLETAQALCEFLGD